MSIAEMMLHSGRRIELVELRISDTYGGVVEGGPSTVVHDELIKAAADQQHGDWPVHLLEPKRTPAATRDRSGGEVRLPRLRCVGFFESAAILEPGELWSVSGLVVVWWQDGIQPLFHDTVREQLLVLPWETVARDAIG